MVSLSKRKRKWQNQYEEIIYKLYAIRWATLIFSSESVVERMHHKGNYNFLFEKLKCVVRESFKGIVLIMLGAVVNTAMLIHVTYNFAILVGFHAMSLRPCAFSHSFRPEIRRVRLGDRDVGEASLISNYLFSKSIPVLFVSGDDECIREMNSIPCGKFSTSKGLKEVMYERLAKSLRASIQKSSLFCGYHDDKVRLDFFNPDLIPILVMKGYNNDEKGSIYFENTSLFFSGIRDFCHELNKCSALLYRRNFELLKEFAGRYGKANVFAACQTHDKSLLREDIAMISHDTLKTALTSLVVHENGVKV